MSKEAGAINANGRRVRLEYRAPGAAWVGEHKFATVDEADDRDAFDYRTVCEDGKVLSVWYAADYRREQEAKKSPPAPALPWRSCKERPPRVGDEFSHDTRRSPNATYCVLEVATSVIYSDRLDGKKPQSPSTGYRYITGRSAWDLGACYVWTPREPDAKADTFPAIPGHAWGPPAKPEPTAAEKRREEWRKNWRRGSDQPPVFTAGLVIASSAVAKLEGVPSGSPLERANAHLRPRFRSSPPYKSPGAGRDR